MQKLLILLAICFVLIEFSTAYPYGGYGMMGGYGGYPYGMMGRGYGMYGRGMYGPGMMGGMYGPGMMGGMYPGMMGMYGK